MRFKYSKIEQELNKFLKGYLDDKSYDNLIERLDFPQEKGNQVSEKINDFYNQQLNIDKDSYKERLRVDRIITFSQKALNRDKFSNLLVELARICLAEGKLDLANEIFRKANKLSPNDYSKAESYLGLAEVFSRKANWSRSFEMISQAKYLFKSLDDYKGLAKCENFLGTIYGELGDILKAKKYLLSSLSLINSDDDVVLAANLYTNLGIIYHIQEESIDSIKYFEKALKLYQKLGHSMNTAKVNLNIGLVYFDTGDYDKSIFNLDAAIEIAKKENYLSSLCLIYHAKSEVLLKQKDFAYASEFADKALEISHSADDKLTVADIYKVKGIIARELNDYEASETYFLNSLRINNSLNNELNAAEVSIELGILYEMTNSLKSKKSYFAKSKQYYTTIGAPAKVEMISELLVSNSVS